MKNLLHNIQILMMLAIMVVGIQSCSDDLHDVGDVEVNFTAMLPTDTRTRSFGKAEQVNTLVVGVFNTQKEELERKEFAINGTSVNITLALAQNQTYSFIFWAYDSNRNIYDIDDLTAIEMNTLPNPITFSEAEASDAFFATEEDIIITGSSSYSIELVRPLAQINVGTTGKVMQASFTAKSAPDTFHPFTNTVSGTVDFTWNFSDTTTETFSADGTAYNYLAMGYLFAPTTAMQIVAELTLTDDEQTSTTVEFPKVEIESNKRSNIAGRFTAE